MTDSPRIETRSRARRWLRDWRLWAVVVVALYTIAGFFVVPMIAKRQVTSQAKSLLQCDAHVAGVRFNPYTFNTSVSGLVLQDRRGDTLLTFDRVFVNFAPWPLRKRVVALEEVRLSSPSLAVRVRADGSINLLDLVPAVSPADSAAGAVTPDSAAASAKPWVVRVDQLDIANMTLLYDDVTAPTRAVVDSLNLAVSDFVAQAGDSAEFDVRLSWRDGGQIRAAGFAAPMDGVVHARIDIDSLNVTPAGPYLTRFAHLEMRSGKLNVHGDVDVITAAGEPPDTRFEGDVIMDDLELFDTLKNESFFGFDRLAVLKMSAASQPPGAEVEEIALNGIYARIAIAKDRTININDVFAPSRARADSTHPPAGVAGGAPAAPGGGVTGDRTRRAASPAGGGAASAPPDIAIGRITIDGGEVDFSDLSLPLPFATRVHSVKGQITAVAPDNAAGSEVNIEGTVDQHGFAKATGFINVFDPIAFTNLDVSFRNIELTSLTPYSGKFAGYRIKQGKLSLGLEYDIQNAQLKGDNEILLEKLTLGEKVESPDATSLPVKLAIALLKDSNGNIDLDLEVAGDLNDPKVNTWSLVWQALKKVLVKVTTAPFRFLGNLLGIGGDEMEYVEFEPGRTTLTPPQHERLGNLAKALKEKPGLKLDVRGAYDKRADTDAIRAERFNALLETRLVAAAGGDSSAASAIKSNPSSGRMQAVLEALYTESFGAEKLAALRTTHTQASATPTPEKAPAKPATAAPPLDLATYFAAMRDELIAAQPVVDADLAKLAGDRSAAIRGYLIEMQTIPQERIAVLEYDVHDDDEDWVRCKLALDAAE